MSDPVNPGAPVAPEAPPPSAPAQPPAAAPPTTPAVRTLNPYAAASARPQSAAPTQPPAVVPPAPPAAPAPDVDALRRDMDGLRAVIAGTVAQDLAAVAENVRASVLAIAGDDPVAQRRTLDALRANGIAAPPSATPAPIAPPATTINAPPSVAPEVRTQEGADADVLRRYEALRRDGNHYLAGQFLLSNAGAIERAQSRTNVS